MANQYKEIVYSALLGMTLGAIGVFLMGYIAAIAVPEEFFSWFESAEPALFVINFMSQFLAFGVIAILTGTLIGRLSKMWFLNSFVSYVAFLLFVVTGTAIINSGEISSPFPNFTFYNLPSLLILPACLLASSFLSARKL